MKRITLFFVMALLVTAVHGQARLQFSRISPYGGSNVENDHSFHSNIGEPLNNLDIANRLMVCNGLFPGQENFYPETYIEVKFYLDEDESGTKNDDEKYYEFGAVDFENETFKILDEQGIVFFATEGTYNLGYNRIGSDGWYITTDSLFTVSLSDTNPNESIEMGFAPLEFYSSVVPYLSSENFRCNDTVKHTLTVINEGTYPEQDTVWVNVDDRIEEIFLNYGPADFIVDDNNIGWLFNLDPFESQTFCFDLPVPGITSAAQLGEIYFITASIENPAYANVHVLEQELRCSYDPNDKAVSPSRDDNLALLDNGPLLYHIRFQNTGNDYAEDVVVRDTLDPNLDVSTFKLIETSHPNDLRVVFNNNNPNIVNFKFDDIILPDSLSNPEGSNGHIIYSISTFPGLDVDTEITNTAHIYFDFNPAIVTNTTLTILVDEFPPVLSNPYLEGKEEIKVYPNPTSGNLNFDREIDQIILTDLLGKQIRKKTSSAFINLDGISTGTYLIQMHLGEERYAEKVIYIKH